MLEPRGELLSRHTQVVHPEHVGVAEQQVLDLKALSEQRFEDAHRLRSEQWPLDEDAFAEGMDAITNSALLAQKLDRDAPRNDGTSWVSLIEVGL